MRLRHAAVFPAWGCWAWALYEWSAWSWLMVMAGFLIYLMGIACDSGK